MNIEEIARICHAVNKAYCAAIGDDSQKPWDEADQWQRDAAVNGVKFRIENPEVPISAQHENWMEDKVAAGWTYGPVKDGTAKTHPCLVPYEELPGTEKAKDALFVAVVDSLK